MNKKLSLKTLLQYYKQVVLKRSEFAMREKSLTKVFMASEPLDF